eukprot:COSAG04_NODE_1432_length_6795_cov_3.370221_2_plen_122_part_00
MAPSAAARRLRSVARARLGERRASLPARNDVAGAASEAEIAEVEYLWEDSDEARAEPLSQKQIDFFMTECALRARHLMPTCSALCVRLTVYAVSLRTGATCSCPASSASSTRASCAAISTR